MERLRELLRRFAYLATRSRRSQELADEMDFHREMAERNRGPQGRRDFGNPALLREQAREAWGLTWIDRLLQDLRFAIRMLARSPGFTATAILVLAIGIGVNVAAFSVFNLLTLKPLPIRDPDSLLRLERRSPEIISGQMPYTTANYFRDNAHTLSAVLTVAGTLTFVDNDLQPVSTSFVSANYFQDLGGRPAYGRFFDPAREDSQAAPPVVVLGHDYWQRHFGADPGMVGKTIHINNKAATVIGIEPYAFPSLKGNGAAVWIPIAQQPWFVEGSKMLTSTSEGSVEVWARLAPGVTERAAAQELLQLVNQRRKQFPKDTWDGEYIRTDPGSHNVIMEKQGYLAVAIVGVLSLLILAVACANLGGLMLARGVARERELGIRLAVGASASRVFRQLFTESLLLALLGSIAGLALAWVAIRITLVSTDAPTWMSAAPDWRVISFVAVMAVLASLLFGFAPALQMARQRHRKNLARQVLVGAQVAASCVLLIVASLLVRAVQHALYTNPGFGYEQVISIAPGLGDHGYKPAAAQAYLDQFRRRIESLPGVTSVALVKLPPLGHGVTRIDSTVDGRDLGIYPNSVDPEFFHTMDIPLLAGRNFLPGEKNAVIVSQSMARAQWPNQNPIGKTYWDKDTVVGIVGNARINALNEDDTVEIYSSLTPEDMPSLCLVLKTAGAPDGLTPQLKSISQALDPKLFPEISLLKANFRRDMKSIELASGIASLVGVCAMLLAGIGILGLVALTASQRSKEIAIRLALGAPKTSVLRALLLQFRWPVAVGLVVGLGAAAALSQVLRRILYGVSNLDPASYLAALTVLCAILAAAALLPARRALRLDIAKALHEE